MIPAVVVSLVVVTSAVALPLTNQKHPITGISATPEIQSGSPLTILPQEIEKTGVQTFEIYTPTGGATQTVQSEQYAGLNTPQRQQVEKTGVQISSEVEANQEYSGNSQKNTAISKVENVPLNVEEVQTFYTQNPVLLPVQPLSIVPVNPTGQILRPVVVPAEAIADGRVIITPVGSIQQRNFHQDVFAIPENQVMQEQVNQPLTYTSVSTQGVEQNQRPYYVEPIEKKSSGNQGNQPASQDYPDQETLNREQQTPNKNIVQQTAEPIQNFYQPQQNVQSVVTESAEKQATYQVITTKVSGQAESNPQQQVFKFVPQASENQVPYQQNQVYSGTPVVVENVEKQVPYQQSTVYQPQNVESGYQQQQVYNPQQVIKKQTQYQQVHNTRYTPAQNFQVEQNVAEKTEKQVEHQQDVAQAQQQVQNVQETVEKQLPNQFIQSPNDAAVQTHPVQGQQQVYSVQSQQVPHYQATQQDVENVSEQVLKTSEVEPNQQVDNVQPQYVANYAGEPTYNFGDKVPQGQHYIPVHTLLGVPQTQENSVQPFVSSTQK